MKLWLVAAFGDANEHADSGNVWGLTRSAARRVRRGRHNEWLPLSSDVHRLLDRMCGQTNTQCTRDLEDCVEARFCSGSEGFVQALPPEARVFRNLSHAASPRDIGKCEQKEVGILSLQHGRHVLRDGDLVVQERAASKGRSLVLGLRVAAGRDLLMSRAPIASIGVERA